MRLWVHTSAGWLTPRDYTYTTASPTKAIMATPVPESTFGYSNVTFSWAVIYVRLWTQFNGAWLFKVLSGSAVTFTWTAGAGATAYWLDVGTVQGQGNIFGQNVGLATSRSVPGIPTNGGTIYVRLWTQTGGAWTYNDYSYTASGKAAISGPAALSGSAVTFTWTAASGATAYWLDVGTVQGQGNIFGQNVGLATSQNVTGIPANGGLIYVRLWTQLAGNWLYNDYVYTAPAGS